MKRFIGNIMPYLAKFHPKNKIERRQEYPQLWYCVPFKRNSKGRKFAEFICGLLIGHEISNTEWGYGGGDYVDRNCRWCDKLIKVRKEEEIPPPVLEDLIDELGFYE